MTKNALNGLDAIILYHLGFIGMSVVDLNKERSKA